MARQLKTKQRKAKFYANRVIVHCVYCKRETASYDLVVINSKPFFACSKRSGACSSVTTQTA